MRIRKRKVPLPLSLLSPVPLSDPHLFSQSPVHLHHPQPSDHLPATSPSDLRPSILQLQQEQEQEQRSCLGFQRGGGERILHQKSNNDDDDARKEETMVSRTSNALGGGSLTNEVGSVGRWSEGERVMPLKKRRSSGMSFFDNKDEDRDGNGEDKKEVIQVNNEGNNNSGSSSNNNNNKQKRGTTIMEGSRCSRVNGRGWRCCQPTLVGYSLCEHHLGKGRLRSMSTTVRGGRPSPSPASSSKKKKQVVGVVKARSLSSLLGQTANYTTTTSTTTTIITNNNNNNVDREISNIGFREST